MALVQGVVGAYQKSLTSSMSLLSDVAGLFPANRHE